MARTMDAQTALLMTLLQRSATVLSRILRCIENRRWVHQPLTINAWESCMLNMDKTVLQVWRADHFTPITYPQSSALICMSAEPHGRFSLSRPWYILMDVRLLSTLWTCVLGLEFHDYDVVHVRWICHVHSPPCNLLLGFLPAL